MTKLAILLSALLSASAASAEDPYSSANHPYSSANHFLPMCRAAIAITDDPNGLGRGISRGDARHCLGLIEGMEALATFNIFCPPAGVTTGQQMRVVIAFIEARPQRLHEDFRLLAVEALRQAWPCKK